LDKEYEADVLLGLTTDTLDTEGKIRPFIGVYPEQRRRVQDDISEIRNPGESRQTTTPKGGQANHKPPTTNHQLQTVLNSFQPEYLQDVPVYSSVKVKGEKLRELARKYERFEIIEKDHEKFIEFFKNDEIIKEVKLPSKVVKIYEIELMGLSSLGEYLKENSNVYLEKFKGNLIQDTRFMIQELAKFQVAKIRVKCSKGTYIRQMAFDIGEKLGTQGMLVGLKRTKVGEIGI
jgi:tRNA U55 pseudouridine synthase TruB